MAGNAAVVKNVPDNVMVGGVPAKDSDALAEKISALWNRPEKLERISARNFRHAQEFELERTQLRRKAWFSWMRDYGDEPNRRWFDFAKNNIPQ